MTNAEYQKQRMADSSASLLNRLSLILGEYSATEGTELDCAIRDALTDLRHLCDVHGLDFGDIDAKAYEGYLEELDYARDEVEA